eukprot:scaffold119215_cov50-Phaeocystis_antarctica.AAC.3
MVSPRSSRPWAAPRLSTLVTRTSFSGRHATRRRMLPLRDRSSSIGQPAPSSRILSGRSSSSRLICTEPRLSSPLKRSQSKTSRSRPVSKNSVSSPVNSIFCSQTGSKVFLITSLFSLHAPTRSRT